MDVFRTASGQTGKDAYMYEAQAIANSYRDLAAKMERLLRAMHVEQPEGFDVSSDYSPHFDCHPEHAASLVRYVRERDFR